MELLFDILAEIIFEPIIEVYLSAMSHFSSVIRKINEDKIRIVVVFEGIVLLVMFVVGGCMLLESDGESLTGKILFISSIAISVVQILSGIFLSKMKKKSQSDVKVKIPVNHYKETDKDLFINGGSLYVSDCDLVLKSLFGKKAVFSLDKVKCRNLPDEFFLKAVELSDGNKSFVLLLIKPNYLKLCEIIRL